MLCFQQASLVIAVCLCAAEQWQDSFLIQSCVKRIPFFETSCSPVDREGINLILAESFSINVMHRMSVLGYKYKYHPATTTHTSLVHWSVIKSAPILSRLFGAEFGLEILLDLGKDFFTTFFWMVHTLLPGQQPSVAGVCGPIRKTDCLLLKGVTESVPLMSRHVGLAHGIMGSPEPD